MGLRTRKSHAARPPLRKAWKNGDGLAFAKRAGGAPLLSPVAEWSQGESIGRGTQPAT